MRSIQKHYLKFAGAIVAVLMATSIGLAQDGSTSQEKLPGDETSKQVTDKVSELGSTINQDETAKQVTTSILDPIYQAAEFIAFPTFYWIAFALMVAGVVSYAGQLVLSKLFLLLQMKLNIKEVLSDFLSLLISAVGLVLTTQAATENSTFTQSPVAVLSATAVGAILGVMLYIWGQGQEFKAARAESMKAKV